ncbi:MAG: SLAC1 anion channel family protein [Campylobacter sp.]
MKNENLRRLANFPIMFFAVVMGLGGLSLAYEKLSFIFGLPNFIFEFLRATTSVIFVVVTILYGLKILKYPNEFKAELNHPIRINFFAAFCISLLLLATLWKGFVAYDALFYAGILMQTLITFYVIKFWIDNNLAILQINPAWFIPVVGNLIVPIAAPMSSFFAWYYFSVGIFFWIVLFVIVFYRIIFHEQLAQKFIPTLFIIIAPPAIGFLDFAKLTGELNSFGIMMLNLTLFFVGLAIFMFKRFLRLKFFLSWWAFTFPTAAASIAFLRAFELGLGKFYLIAGVFSFVALVSLILLVGFLTVKSISKCEICVID